MDRRKIFAIFLLFLGCNVVKDCELDENRRLALVEFFQFSDFQPIDTLIFIQVASPQSPYVFYTSEDTLFRAIFLPLDPEGDTTEFVLETDSFNVDLQFSYQREFSVYDVNCDPSIRFFDLSVNSAVVDSIAIENPALTSEELTNVKVYL